MDRASWDFEDEDGRELEPVAMASTRDAVCPQCRTYGTLQEYVHGLPTAETLHDPRVVIAGCVVGPDPQPAYRCAQCGADFDRQGNVLPAVPGDPPASTAPRVRRRRNG